MNIDPNWVMAILATLTFAGGLWKIAMAIGKNTEITKQILRNQTRQQEDLTTLTSRCNDHEGRLIAVETTLKLEAQQ